MARSNRLGRTGHGDDLLSVRLDGRRIIRLTDALLNKFRGGAFQDAVATVHDDAAVKIQQAMVKSLRAQIDPERNQRPGKRLEKSLLHESNREVTASSFTVLRPSWMDRSPAAVYWRQIEEGNDDIYFTRVLFTNNSAGPSHVGYGGPFSAPWSPGGSTSQSLRRNARTGGKVYSRPKPIGYKHMRMPMGLTQGVPVAAGPFPAFHFTLAGQRVFDDYQFKREYKKRCKAIGINLSDGDFHSRPR